MEEDLPLEQVKEIAKTYSAEELLLEGRRLIEKDYHAALVMFRELSEYEDKRELAKLYLFVLNSIVHNQFKEKSKSIFGMGNEIPKGIEGLIDNSNIDSIIIGMRNSRKMHQEGELSKEDLLTIEKLVDKFPFKKTIIQDKDELEKSYYRFKEYCLEVFVGEK